MSLNIYQRIISDAFDSQNWNYSFKNITPEKDIFWINFTSNKYGRTCCEITIYENGICDIRATLPVVCQEERCREFCYYLARYNFLKRYATLRLNTDDGEVSHNYSFVFNKSTTPKEFLERFSNVKDIDDSVMNDLMFICKRNESGEKSEVLQGSQKVSSIKNSKHKLSL
ncbi:MAG: hypothetical protein IJY09_05680 [Lachnospiraceae bacterium]|nr:hypothetical protein [Lachnospiraceae bacterium]